MKIQSDAIDLRHTSKVRRHVPNAANCIASLRYLLYYPVFVHNDLVVDVDVRLLVRLQYVLASSFATLHPLLVDHDITKSSRIRRFVRACLRLCWKMVIQHPCSMSFSMSDVGARFDDVIHELHPSSESAAESPDAVLDYHVYPAMRHGDVIRQKALIVLATPQQP